MTNVARRLVTAGALLAAALLLAAPASAQKVRVSHPTLAADQAYFFVALDKGYYKQEGLDVEVLQAGGGVSTPALVSGDLQFSNSAGAAISAILRGARLKVIMVNADRTPFQIWSASPSVTKFADLRGKPIGIISRGDTGEIAIRYYLNAQNLPKDYVSFTPLGNIAARLAAAANGSFPAILLEPLDVEQVKAANLGERVRLLVDLAKEFKMPVTGLAASDKLLQENPELVRKFVKATLKGLRYAQENPEGTIEVLTRFLKATREQVIVDFQQVQRTMTDGTIPDSLQKADTLLRADMLGVPADKATSIQVFRFDFVNAAKQQLVKEGWKAQ